MQLINLNKFLVSIITVLLIAIVAFGVWSYFNELSGMLTLQNKLRGDNTIELLQAKLRSVILNKSVILDRDETLYLDKLLTGVSNSQVVLKPNKKWNDKNLEFSFVFKNNTTASGDIAFDSNYEVMLIDCFISSFDSDPQYQFAELDNSFPDTLKKKIDDLVSTSK